MQLNLYFVTSGEQVQSVSPTIMNLLPNLLDTVTLIGLAAVLLVSLLKDSCSLLDKVQSVGDQRNRTSLQLHPVKPNTSLLSTPQRKVSGYQMFLHNCLGNKLLLFSLSELTTKVPSIRQPAHPLTTAISTSIFVTTMLEKPYETIKLK